MPPTAAALQVRAIFLSSVSVPGLAGNDNVFAGSAADLSGTASIWALLDGRRTGLRVTLQAHGL